MNDVMRLMDNAIHPVYGKSQWVRLIDVFALGPFMVWFGWTARDMPDWARLAMVLSGVATTVYNGANYRRISGQSPEDRLAVAELASRLRDRV